MQIPNVLNAEKQNIQKASKPDILEARAGGSANRTFRNCGAVTKHPAIVCTSAGSDQDSSVYDLPGGAGVVYGRGGQAGWCNRRAACALAAAALAVGMSPA